MADELTLTDAAVRALPPATRGQYTVRDALLPGFRVVVGTRAKTYRVQVDVWRAGRRRTVHRTIGRADDISAKAARAAAKRKIGELQTGAAVPVGRGPTLAEAWGAYRLKMARRGRRPATLKSYRQALEGLLADWLEVPLAQLSPELVQERHEELGRSSGPYAANRAARVLRAVYRHAQRGHRATLPADPCTCLVEWFPEARRQTGVGSRALPAWRAELAAMSNRVRAEFHFFTLLSGSRPDALRRARWEHLDVKRRALHFPDPKGGPRRAFDMPLSRPMLACLARARRAGRLQHRQHAAEWIFPSAVGPIVEWREDRETLSKWGNDLRQTYRTLAVEAGLADADVQLLMNHKLPGVSGGYVTVGALLEHLRAQQERLSAFIVAALRASHAPQR